MEQIGDILRWGVPEFLPAEQTEMEIWRVGWSSSSISYTAELTRNTATNTPFFQLENNSVADIWVRGSARNRTQSTSYELKTTMGIGFGVETLAIDFQDVNNCTNAAQLYNRFNVFRRLPVSENLRTTITQAVAGSGVLCPEGRFQSIEIRLYLYSGNIVKVNSKTGVIPAQTITPERIN